LVEVVAVMAAGTGGGSGVRRDGLFGFLNSRPHVLEEPLISSLAVRKIAAQE
jgi:hypothetical protein